MFNDAIGLGICILIQDVTWAMLNSLGRLKGKGGGGGGGGGGGA